MTLSKRLFSQPKSTSKKQNIYKHNFKSVHVSNFFWSREYNSAKEICKYPSFSKVGGNYPLDLKIIWSSDWLYLLIKHCFFEGGFVVANSGYFTVFNAHIYFIILISMIAGNLVEIRLPKIQSRKCLLKSNLWRYSRKCLWKLNLYKISWVTHMEQELLTLLGVLLH